MKKQTLIDKAFLLKRTPLFESLDLDVLLAFADKLTIIAFDREEEIFPYGQEGHRMYFIAKGSVLIKNQESEILATLSPPDFFGDESVFSGKTRQYQAISASDTLLFALSRTHLNMMISEAPSLALSFLRQYAKTIPWRKKE